MGFLFEGQPRVNYLGAVATRTLQPTTLTAPNKQQMSRVGHFARDHIVGLRVLWGNYYVDSSGVEQGTGQPANFTASIEYPAGVFNQLKFDGAAQGVAPSKSIIMSDYLKVNIPIGKKFWSKCYRTDTAGILYSSPGVGFKSNALHGDAFNFAASGIADTTMTAVATNLDITNIYAPIALIGYTRRGSVLILGDSLGYGQNDTVDAAGDTGLFRFIGADKGYINLSRPSDRAMWFKDNSVLRRTLAQYVSDVVVQHSINDLGSGAQSAVQLEGHLTTIGQLLRNVFPKKRLWLATTVPQTTDGTNAAASSTNANKILVNNWKRLIPAPFDGCIELADNIEGAGAGLVRDGGRFSDNSYILASDGTHLTQAGYLAIASGGFVNSSSFNL